MCRKNYGWKSVILCRRQQTKPSQRKRKLRRQNGYLKVKIAQLCLTLGNLMDSPWNSPGQNTGVGSLSLLQEVFPTQGWNLGFLHCRWILYQLSHKRGPRILSWVAYPFSSGSSWPRNQTRVSCITGRFFTNWAIREALPSEEAYI